MKNKIVIGTRSSKLALWQAEFVKAELQKLYPELTVELNKIKTTGDKILDVPLAKVGGKGLFVKEIEDALLKGEADLAVHSMKDVPTEFPAGLYLAVICEREDPRDVFIAGIQDSKFKIQNFKAVPKGARIGTSSLRRACQLLSIRPDLKIEQLRGNVDTRIRKLDEGQYDSIILAAAGAKRLGLKHRITEFLPFEVSLPAIGQGAVGIECREDDEFVNKLIAPLNHAETAVCVRTERAFLKKLEGGCQVPIAAHAKITKKQLTVNSHQSLANSPSDDTGSREYSDSELRTLASASRPGRPNSELLVLDGLVGSIAGDRIIKGHSEGNPADAEKIGTALAEDVLSRGAKTILDEVYGRS